MAYTIDRRFDGAAIDSVESRLRSALAEQGFGVLTYIDVQATMKAKLGAETAPYRILGACNPGMAHAAIELEPQVGAMLPCNVILRELDGGVMASAIDPVASMQAIDNPQLHAKAADVRALLEAAVTAA